MEKWWRGRRIDGSDYSKAIEGEVPPLRPRSKRKRRRPINFWLLVVLLLGAVITVLAVYPILPTDAQIWILDIQQNVADYVPWGKS